MMKKADLGKQVRIPLLLFSVVLLVASGAQALDFSGVPGTVLDYYELNYGFFSSTPDQFISDPAICVLSNGNYVAAHSMSGKDFGTGDTRYTDLFVSTDQGATWSSLATVSSLFTASIVEHGGYLWMIGTTANGGVNVTFRSANGGTNWIESSAFSQQGHFTPDSPITYNGRLWTGANTGTWNAPENSDLLNASNWTVVGGMPAPQAGWLTGTAKIEEGQIVGIPGKGLFLAMRVNDFPYAVINRVDPTTGAVCFDPAHNYAPMPGGEKKFGAKYDPTSGKVFAVSSPVLPAYPGSEPHNMVRNTGAILSSRDMLNWKVEKLYVFSNDWDVDGFAYVNFDFDGGDLVIANRTAFPVPGENNPERGHDSNILGFFKVPGFRTLVPDQYLSISGNQILRYERTQYQDAPLGTFQLGVALNSPSQLGQDSNGDVYVQDGGGIQHFDASGNFLGTVASTPISLQSSPLDVTPPADGICTWLKSGSGDWIDPLNWHYWNRPDTSEDIAIFGSAASAATTVDIPSDSREWLFETDSDFEGWIPNHFGSSAVSSGAFHGTPDTGDPQLYRLDQSFYADDVPNIVVRMKADVPNATVGIFWGTGAELSFAADKHIQATYTGNGEFQDVVLPMAGHAKWDGQIVARIRIDPLDDGKTDPVVIDSITVLKAETHMKGLRFISAQPYTLAGTGALAIEADSGNGTIDVQQGMHRIDLPVALASDTDFYAAAGTSLKLSRELDLNGKALVAEGAGQLVVEDGSFQMNSGSLTVGEGSSVLFSNTVFQFNGTVEFAAPQNFNPSSGDSFHVIEGDATEGLFGQLVFPTLEEGLGWDTSALYTSGDIAVILKTPEAWMAQYGLPTDGSADFIDSDGDTQDNYSEWKAGTNPTNALSFFDFDSSGTMPVATGIQLRWNSLTNRTYRIEFGTNLMDNPAFTLLLSGIPGEEEVTDFIDTSATNQNQGFYRVYVE